ncbi:hypothetical protein [Bradyrhizobium sp. NBAIM14]|nr:hypothetical protein [Bradyrhizobium sp. NBAIM14]MCA1501675.1 hypothetical protein [Bradyrhizobium sp. NBAIM14]
MKNNLDKTIADAQTILDRFPRGSSGIRFVDEALRKFTAVMALKFGEA